MLLALALVPAGAAVAQGCLAETAAMPGSLARMDAPVGPVSAWYEDATAIYGHDIMGSLQDALTLRIAVRGDSGCRLAAAPAGAGHVFEDIAPRLVDLDGDGVPEVIAVRSSLTEGAQLAIYGVEGEALTLLDATPYIGRRHRWLAPAAWEDLDGDGRIEIAYVDRPHLAKMLRVWRWEDGTLVPVAALEGVTNHAIGEETIFGFVRPCERRELVLQSTHRDRLVGVTLARERLTSRFLGPVTDAEEMRACSE